MEERDIPDLDTEAETEPTAHERRVAEIEEERAPTPGEDPNSDQELESPRGWQHETPEDLGR
jgi:hypothetical protein